MKSSCELTEYELGEQWRAGVCIYPYACHESERDLCRLELSSLFEAGTDSTLFSSRFEAKSGSRNYIQSLKIIAPDRSPFISMRVDIGLQTPTLEELLEQAEHLTLNERSFKIMYLKCGEMRSYEEQREMERLVGRRIQGKAEMRSPDLLFGLLASEEGWQLGICRQGLRPWLTHKHKPSNYSTGLPATVARSLVNIAVPEPEEIKVIDPCCGMGNVMIEALSMGIDIVGVDINPLAVQGARKNLSFFGYDPAALVKLGDMNEVREHYDSAILDMPYNLCSVLPESDKLNMLTSLGQISSRAVIVTTEEIADLLPGCGLRAIGYASLDKGSFRRHIWLCVRN
ncbi:TRM11 family SAM-dependent methyltransferase [Paenibacillus brevis]|uniref:Methyltransferase domain-containing protein n=1 Tax=Paenibacillus brevis TaxID=2841508 RepID=A0ABS6FQY0_9BACL|nr:methyltransferase domain-containing protein [Paenibacillus brevis]MBU5671848.1 methyltransferase domain-containing protein [Paenibacillus brevis]